MSGVKKRVWVSGGPETSLDPCRGLRSNSLSARGCSQVRTFFRVKVARQSTHKYTTDMNIPDKSKGGRPPKSEAMKRNHIIKAKLTKAEIEIVKAKAARAGVTMYEYMRQAVLTAQVVKPEPPISPEEWEILKELMVAVRNLGINVNTIALKANNNLVRNYAYDMILFLQEAEKIKQNYIDKLP